jgi:DNA repair exonuclease SbcCD ATPase subunit
LVGLWLALPTVAQDREGQRPGRQRERRMGGERRGFGGQRFSIERMAGRIAEQLELDDEQKAQFDKIVAEFEERSQQQRGNREQMGEIRREMRAAREDGDDERVAELRAQMRELGGGNPMNDFYDKIEPILRDDQKRQLSQMRERFGQRGGRGMGRGGAMQQIERLRGRLNLDDEQREQFDRLLEDARESMQEQRRGRFEEIRPLIEELREAQREGDEERVQELREKFREMRGGGGDNAALEDLYAQLEKILRDDQREILAQFREQQQQRGRRGGRGGDQNDVRGLLRVAKRLDLNDEQKDELRQVEQESMRALREVRRDREAQADLAKQVKKEITAILNSEQAERFERLLQRGSRGDRSGRERSGRGRDRQPRRQRQRGGDEPPW